MKRILILTVVLLQATLSYAQADTAASQKAHSFSINATAWSRGEIRDGALPAQGEKDYAMFLSSKAVLRLDYAYKALEVRISPKYYGVWGSSSNGGMAVDEAWLGLRHKSGLFFRAGRQKLEYDDERIIGSDDWTMATSTHDIVKAGCERGKHQVHLLLAFNQNDENTNGGTYYIDGGQPYKTMQTLWYHFDPIPQLGASLLFMNTGMQDMTSFYEPEEKRIYRTNYQQLFGAYADWHPKNFRMQASYYRQTGRDEYMLAINAWMTAVEADWDVNARWHLNTGYFFMSGDEYYFVPPHGYIGLTRKTEVRGFNPIFGSHHQFYGAMDFFYVETFFGGNTPGLQDFHVAGRWSPVPALNLGASYHFLATGVKLDKLKRGLGHEVELSASWTILKDVKLDAGYSFMQGTETMAFLKRTSERNRLQWGWIMLSVTPEFFSIKW